MPSPLTVTKIGMTEKALTKNCYEFVGLSLLSKQFENESIKMKFVRIQEDRVIFVLKAHFKVIIRFN